MANMDDEEVPTFAVAVPDVPVDGFRAEDVDGVTWVYRADEDKWKTAEDDILAFIQAHDEDYDHICRNGYEPRFYTVREYVRYYGLERQDTVEEDIARDLLSLNECGTTHAWVVWGGDQLVPVEGDEFVHLYRQDPERLTIVLVDK